MDNTLHENPMRRARRMLLERYQQSLLCFLLGWIAAQWKSSWVCTALTRLLHEEPACLTSRLHGRLRRFHRRLSAKSQQISDTMHESWFWHICRRLLDRLGESRTLGWLFGHGVTGFLLFCIGGYVAWDYLLRDVLAVPVLSSIWDELLLLLCAVWLLYLRATKQARLDVYDTPLDMPVLFFLGISLILLGIGFKYPAVNLAGFRATTQYILWFFVVTRLLRDDGDFRRLYLLMVAVASLIALHGVYQYVVGAPMPESWVDQAEASVRTRVYSIFGSCNIMGDFMVLFAPMTVGLAYAARDRRVKLLAWFCAMVMCLSCLLTMSRGAWIAMAAAALLFAVLVDLRLILAMLAAVFFALFLPFVQSRIGYLFTDAFAESASRGGRAMRWVRAMEYLRRADPVVGIGFGEFGGAIAMQNQLHYSYDYFYTDNYYIKILSENGITGLAAFLVMMLSTLWCSLKAWFRNHRAKSPAARLCAGMLSGMAGVLVHCYFENIFEEPYMMAVFWTVAAMTMYLGFLRPQDRKD